MAMILGGCLGILIERFIYRPIIGRPRIVPLIASIGLLICFSDLFRILAGPDQLAFYIDSLRGVYQIEHLIVSKTQLFILAGTTLIFIVLWFILYKTRLGFAVRAVAQDSEMTEVMGVNEPMRQLGVFH